MGDREVRHLAGAVIFQAIRDAQLIEVGHGMSDRFHACPLESWPDATMRQNKWARRWLMEDPIDDVLQLWTTAIGITPGMLREGLQPRVTWTRRVEAHAPKTRRPPRGSGSPFRRRDEGLK